MNSESKLKEVFSLFQANEATYPVLKNPFLKDGRVWATDMHMAIYVDEKDCDFSYKNDYERDAPNVTRLIEIPNTSKILNLNEADFEKLRTIDEVVKEIVPCNTCFGNGFVVWRFGKFKREDDCPNCNGVGHNLIERKTGKKEFGHYAVRSGDALFSIINIYKLIQVQKLLGGDVELIFEGNNKTSQFFKINKCIIIIMPIIFSSDYCHEILTIN